APYRQRRCRWNARAPAAHLLLAATAGERHRRRRPSAGMTLSRFRLPFPAILWRLVQIPTEPIGSIPRPPELAVASPSDGEGTELEALYEAAVRDTIARFETTGSPVVTDGEPWQYQNFWTCPVHGLPDTA